MFEPERDEGSWADDEDPVPLDAFDDLALLPPDPPPIAISQHDIAAAISADIDRSLAIVRRRWEETPHRCTCGEKVLRAGEICDPCMTRQRERERRLFPVAATTASLPASYKWANFQAPELASRVRDTRAIAAAKAVAMDPAIDRIVFVGPAGAGKTTLACCTLHSLAYERQVTGMYADARTLSLARSQSGLGHEAPIVADCMTANLLLLDDLGLDKADQHGSAVADVIYQRHMDRLVTITTLAIPTAEVAVRYGDGISRRLFEHAAEIEVHR